MTGVWQLPLWLLAGSLFGGLHLLLLYRSIERAQDLDGSRARRQIVRGLPLRLLCWAPVMVLAARSGLLPCAVLILGSLLARWVAWRLGSPSQSPAIAFRD